GRTVMKIAIRVLLMIALIYSTVIHAAEVAEDSSNFEVDEDGYLIVDENGDLVPIESDEDDRDKLDEDEDEFILEYVDEFLGEYWGVSTGVNSARSSGKLKSQSEKTVAYLVQAGYIQSGYNFKFGKNILGVGGFADMHGFERHKNKRAYGNLVVGLNLKFARPVGHWLPYVRLGSGFGSATGDLSEVIGFARSYGFGVEYKFTGKQWSAVIEYKASTFSRNATRVFNKSVFTGFNYYFNEPTVVEEIAEVIEYEPLEVIEEAPPDFAPPI
ncbi:MAG: hypothetical protein R8M11_08185, partial [Gallionella sp.]